MSKFDRYFSFKKSAAILLCLFLIAGCGQKNNNAQNSESMVQAQSLMDQHNYDGAIEKYEEIIKSDPTNEEAKIKLFHANAGAGGFEALKLISILKSAETKLIEVTEKTEDKSLKIKGIKLDVLDDGIAQLDQLLIKVPTLSEKQKQNLDKAINLYEEMGLKIETTNKYNNFKWGTIHAFRLAVDLKAVVTEIKNAKNQANNLKQIERAFLSRGKEMAVDFYHIVKLYSNSYEKFKSIHEKIENLIAKTVKVPKFKFKINAMAKDEKQFYEDVVRDNVIIVSAMANKYIEVSQIETKKIPALKEEAQLRLETLVSLSLKQIISNQNDPESIIKEIFNLDVKAGIYQAIQDSLKNKDLSSLTNYLLKGEIKLKGLVTYAQILLNQTDENSIDDETKTEINAIKSRLDEELQIPTASQSEEVENVAAPTGDEDQDQVK